ncbi:MAG: hypothetical protein HC886_14450 [Leptolyngbyaceae cyanobacterium SM1_1_3]|nr:hypothetical protein [Leptolyngbyaceae cyanobacterium SM1_1_3]NJO11008.1 hypothetical protein [Leptolyngbyaceae cyanobacterium SL_1_1]
MFEPIAAGIIAFVLFVWSVEMLGGGDKGKPDWLPLPKWFFSEKKNKPSPEEELGKNLSAIIKAAIKENK